MPTAEKVAVVEELAEILKQSKGVYLTDFTGIDVPTFTQLRKRLRDESVAYRVVKNRLVLRAVQKVGLTGLGDMLTGPTGLATSDTDPVAPARVISEFAGQADGRPAIKAGFVDGKVYVDDELEALAKLPTREVLLVQMVTAVQSPLSGLAFCLNGILQKLVGTLHALAEKRSSEEDNG